jgi:hypothetical protein
MKALDTILMAVMIPIIGAILITAEISYCVVRDLMIATKEYLKGV